MRLQKWELIRYATYFKTDYTDWKYSIRVKENTIGDNVLELRDNEKETFEIMFCWKTRDAYEFLRGFYRGYRFLNPKE